MAKCSFVHLARDSKASSHIQRFADIDKLENHPKIARVSRGSDMEESCFPVILLARKDFCQRRSANIAQSLGIPCIP